MQKSLPSKSSSFATSSCVICNIRIVETYFASGQGTASRLLRTSKLTLWFSIVTKDAAGYDVSLTDIWGRLLGYQLLSGTDGGAGVTMSSVTSLSSFTSYAVPYPIITALGAKVWDGECAPGKSPV